MDGIILECLFLGAIGFGIVSAVSLIRKKYRKGAICGVSCMGSQMLFAWLWFSSFVHESAGKTWVDLAFSARSRASKVNIAFLACGAGLAVVNGIGFVWKSMLNRSTSNGKCEIFGIG